MFGLPGCIRVARTATGELEAKHVSVVVAAEGPLVEGVVGGG